MDNSREMARLLRKAQDLHQETTRPSFWIVTGVFHDEEVLEPPGGQATFQPWIVIGVEGKRPADSLGKPEGKLSYMS